MLTRTRNALVVAGLGVALAAGLVWASRHRRTPELAHVALDAIPAGALLVATADLDALRASAVGAPLLRQGREIPGLGKVRDVCGFDPIDAVHELAVAIPAGGDAGDFGLVAAGDVDADALVACASKVIQARGGTAELGTVGAFRTVRDGSLGASGEIAVRPHGPVLLGAGAYLRSMIDAAEGRTASVRASAAHGTLGREVGEGALRVSVVLTPEQREALSFALRAEGPAGAPAASIAAAGAAVGLGPTVSVTAVLLCDTESACAELVPTLKSVRDARARDLGARFLGVGALLERVEIGARDGGLRAHVELPAEEASALLERVLAARGLHHPPPERASAPIGAPAAPPPEPDDVLRDRGAAPADSKGGRPGSPPAPSSASSPSSQPKR